MVTDSHGEALADDESKGVRQVSEKTSKIISGFLEDFKEAELMGRMT